MGWVFVLLVDGDLAVRREQARHSGLCACGGGGGNIWIAKVSKGLLMNGRLMEGRRYKIMDTVAKKNVCITDGMAWIESQLYHV